MSAGSLTGLSLNKPIVVLANPPGVIQCGVIQSGAILSLSRAYGRACPELVEGRSEESQPADNGALACKEILNPAARASEDDVMLQTGWSGGAGGRLPRCRAPLNAAKP